MGPAVLMGGALFVLGLAGYGFLAISGHTLSTADAAAVASFYLIISIVGPGVAAGLEQEISRSTSASLARGGSLRVVAGRGAAVGLGLALVVVAVLFVAAGVLTDKALAGQWGLFAAIIFGVVGSAAACWVRGLLGGMQRFAGYAASLTAEGLSRIVMCVVLIVVGTTDPTIFAMVFAAGAVFALLAGLPWLRGKPTAVEVTDEVPHDSVPAMTRGLVLLVGATLGFQTVANLAPVLVTARLEDDTALASAFASAFVLVRIPVLLFAAVGAMLLPALTKAVTSGDLPAFRSTLRKIMLALAAIGVPTVVGATLLGPWAVEFLFGAKVRLPAAVLGLLALSTVVLMVTQVLLPALVALGKHRVVTLAWALGTVVVVGLLVLPLDPVNTAVWAQLAGCGLVALTMAVTLMMSLRARASAAPPPPVRQPG